MSESGVSATYTPRVHRWMALYLGVLATIVAVVAAIGSFGRGDGATEPFVSARGELYDVVTTGVYINNPQRLVAEGIGWDLVTLFLVVPALLLVIRGVARGSLRARLFSIGILGYLFYQYLMYAMAWAVGPLLLPFVLIYAASLVGIAWLVSTVRLAELPGHVTDRFPRRAMAILCILVVVLLLGMWVPMIADVVSGQLEGSLLGQTTLVVQALDLGLVVPLAAATAVLLWRRRPVGYLLAATMVVKALAMGVAICAMVLSAWNVEGELDVGPLAIFAAIAVASLVLMTAMYRALREDRASIPDEALVLNM